MNPLSKIQTTMSCFVTMSLLIRFFVQWRIHFINASYKWNKRSLIDLSTWNFGYLAHLIIETRRMCESDLGGFHHFPSRWFRWFLYGNFQPLNQISWRFSGIRWAFLQLNLSFWLEIERENYGRKMERGDHQWGFFCAWMQQLFLKQ